MVMKRPCSLRAFTVSTRALAVRLPYMTTTRRGDWSLVPKAAMGWG